MTTGQAYNAATDALQYLFLWIQELLNNQVLFLTKVDLLTFETTIDSARFATILEDWFYNGNENLRNYLLLPQLGFAGTNFERFAVSGIQFLVEAILARTLRQTSFRAKFKAEIISDPLHPVITIRKRYKGL